MNALWTECKVMDGSFDACLSYLGEPSGDLLEVVHGGADVVQAQEEHVVLLQGNNETATKGERDMRRYHDVRNMILLSSVMTYP